MINPPKDTLLTPAEVAELFSVSVQTIANWAEAGKLVSVRTPGGQRRFSAIEVARLLTPLRDRRSRRYQHGIRHAGYVQTVALEAAPPLEG